jgi:hypothetical protein
MQTRITLDEEGVSLPLVERLMEGEVVYSRKVQAVMIQKIMIEIADEWMLFDSILGSKTGPSEIISRIFEYVTEHKTDEGERIFASLVDFVKTTQTGFNLSELFHVLCDKVNVAGLDNAAYNGGVLLGMISRIENITDPAALLELLSTLLGKTHFFDSPDKEVLKSVLSVVQARVSEFEAGDVLDEVWAHLASQATKTKVLEVATPFLDDIELVTPILPKKCVFYKSTHLHYVL